MVTADGQPAKGAIVAVTWGTAPTPEIGIVADDEGGFIVALPPGRFRLQANAQGKSGQAEVEVASEAPSIEIKLDR